MTFPKCAIFALPLLILTAGCAAKKTIIGKWQGSAPLPAGRVPGLPATLPMTFDFKPDNTLTVNATLAMPAATMQIAMQEKYTLSGETLTTTPVSTSLNGRPMPLNPATAHPSSGTYKLEGDKLIVSNAGQSFTLTRVKQ